MTTRNRVLVILLAITVGLWMAAPANAQLGSLKKKAQKKAEEKIDKKADEVLEGKEAEPAEAPTETPAAEGTSTGGSAESAKPGTSPWLNYDFVPGSRVIFFDDFAKDVVGNFPQRLEFIEGNMEVAEWNKTRWLRSSTRSAFFVQLPDTLPPKFTIEFDQYTGSPGWNRVSIIGGEDGADQDEVFMDITNRQAGLRNYQGSSIAMAAVPEPAYADVMRCRIMADGPYVKVYVNENRVANVPKVEFIRSKSLRFDVDANAERPLLIGSIRIAASDKTMYDAIAATGRYTTQGILFDSGSDRIRPESTPTLKEIGKMLADHPDLRIMIEGHTDNVGDDTSNMSLSERRAAAVKDHLAASYGIDASRLESKGFGESKPVASNDTAEGRQNNRRVELVKL